MKRAMLTALVSIFFIAFSGYSQTTAILIDTSRSVPKQDFNLAKQKLIELAPGLLKQGSVTVVSFNDEPVVEGSSLSDLSSVSQRIEGISQGGNFTLLNDALFKTLMIFEDSNERGIILLVSDGKDENSAITLEDVAKKAESLKIPIIALGIGREDKSLRRLSALTKGSYENSIQAFSPSHLLSSIQDLRAKEEPPAAEEKPLPVQVPALPPPAAEKGPSQFFLTAPAFILACAVVIALAVAIFFLVKGKKEKERVCEKCGRPLSLWETECPNCFIKELSDTQPGIFDKNKAQTVPPADIDPELFKKAPTSDELDSTMVLEEIPVLLHLRGNQPSRMFQVLKDKATSVGRDKINSVSVDDRTLSGQHFRIVPKDGAWFILDLDSTNGTFVDGERVKFKELGSGAQIHAGQCQFIFRLEQKRLNP